MHSERARTDDGEPSLTREDAFFELRFTPKAALIATVREFVGDFYAQVLGDDDFSTRLAMATHELLENSFRYGIDGRSSIHVVAHREKERVKVAIETQNRATLDALARARRELDGVVGAADPSAHYLTLVRRAAARTDGGSGLGLGRIRVETDLALSYEIVGDVIRILATGEYAPRRGGASLRPSEVPR
jgi:hypothetical protein